MSVFYMLECLVPDNETILDLHNYPVLDGIDSWLLGAPFVKPLAQPIKLQWNPETEGVKKSMYDATIPLMHKDLMQALQALGVDNLDYYPVEIEHDSSGEMDHDYCAFNVLGAMAAVDLSNSIFFDPSGMGRIDMDIEKLAIAERIAGDVLLFRLAECVTGLVVHESIKKGLEARGGFGLTFVAPEEWIG